MFQDPRVIDKLTTMRQEMINEEIRFWRRLIEKWEITRGEPAPDRMRDALATAEMRLEMAVAEDGCEQTRRLFH